MIFDENIIFGFNFDLRDVLSLIFAVRAYVFYFKRAGLGSNCFHFFSDFNIIEVNFYGKINFLVSAVQNSVRRGEFYRTADCYRTRKGGSL